MKKTRAKEQLIHVTHWEIQVFLRFSGELVSFRKLGQPDLYTLL